MLTLLPTLGLAATLTKLGALDFHMPHLTTLEAWAYFLTRTLYLSLGFGSPFLESLLLLGKEILFRRISRFSHICHLGVCHIFLLSPLSLNIKLGGERIHIQNNMWHVQREHNRFPRCWQTAYHSLDLELISYGTTQAGQFLGNDKLAIYMIHHIINFLHLHSHLKMPDGALWLSDDWWHASIQR